MSWLDSVVNLLGLGYEVSKDQHLTGAQREANAFSSNEADKARAFSAQQAEIGRDWQEQQYLKYNSPQALVQQYQGAGINPSLMFGGQTPAASMAAPTASSSMASSVSPTGGNLVGMIGELMKLSMLGEQKRALELQNDSAALEYEIRRTYGPAEADARLRQIEQAINQSLAETGEASTRSALNKATADLYKVRKSNEEFEKTRKEWEQKFIQDYHMTPELAGELIRSAATLASAGLISAGQLISKFAGKKGTHTRSITEKQADGTTITDTFSGFPDM